MIRTGERPILRELRVLGQERLWGGEGGVSQGLCGWLGEALWGWGASRVRQIWRGRCGELEQGGPNVADRKG
jgi:hypothetical protein